MHHLDLSPEESAIVRGVLVARLAEIRHEEHYTDNRGFKADLVQREEILARVLSRMREGAAVTGEPVGA